MLARIPAADEGSYILARLEASYLEAVIASGGRPVDVELLMGSRWYLGHHIDSVHGNWMALQRQLHSCHSIGSFSRPRQCLQRAVWKRIDRLLGPLLL